MNAATQKANEDFLRRLNLRLPDPANCPTLHAADFTAYCCQDCGQVEDAHRVGGVWLCAKCGAPVTPLTIHGGNPHLGR